MGNRGLAIATGIAEGIDSAAKNLLVLANAKQKLTMDQETHSADLKIKKAQLDKFELLYGPEQVQAERDKLKAETAANTALFNLRNIQITREQSKNQQELESHGKAMTILDNAIKGGRIPPGLRINSKGDFSMSGQKEETDLSALLGDNNGGLPAAAPAATGGADWWNK